MCSHSSDSRAPSRAHTTDSVEQRGRTHRRLRPPRARCRGATERVRARTPPPRPASYSEAVFLPPHPRANRRNSLPTTTTPRRNSARASSVTSCDETWWGRRHGGTRPPLFCVLKNACLCGVSVESGWGIVNSKADGSRQTHALLNAFILRTGSLSLISETLSSLRPRVELNNASPLPSLCPPSFLLE